MIPLPSFLSTPPLVVGRPVLWAIELFKPVIPINLLKENDTPNFLPNPNITYNVIRDSLNLFRAFFL